MIVPGGGLSPDRARWVACKPGFFLHVRVLSRLFRRLFIEGLMALHRAGDLAFFGDLIRLSDTDRFAKYLAPLRKIEWVVYAKPPFGGPEAVILLGIRGARLNAIQKISREADKIFCYQGFHFSFAEW